MQLPIHHVGILVKRISEKLSYYKQLGFLVEEAIFTDPYQKIKAGKVHAHNGVVLELLEPLDETSPIYKISKSNLVYHHLCFEVDSIDEYIDYITKNKLGFKISSKTPSIFEGRMVCFFANADRELFELIEKA